MQYMCKEIYEKLNKLKELHGEEFCTQFEKAYAYWPSLSEIDDRTEVSTEELAVNKKVQYEAGWLDATEGIQQMFAGFKITEQSLANMKMEDCIPRKYVFDKLLTLNNVTIQGQAKFIAILKQTIGEKQTALFKQLILKHSLI